MNMAAAASDDLFKILSKMSDTQLLELAKTCELYDDKNYPAGDNNEIANEIVIDFVNRLVGKNLRSLDELIDITINNNQFVRAIDDISKNSIYFKNEEENWKLFFDTKYETTDVKDQEYYFNIIKSILYLYAINMDVKKNTKSEPSYILSVDKEIKNIVESRHGKN